jgi:hypothetical protein
MKFTIADALEILERTPDVINSLIGHISEAWTSQNEGDQTWSPYDVVGHLIHGEKTDWMTRTELILSNEPNKNFTPFDRFAQYNDSAGKSMKDLINEFKELRERNLNLLRSKNITDADMKRTGIHPAFGEVTLLQLLSTWVVHDLNHISQIARVMAFQYKEEVGPWVPYLGILKSV